MPENVQGDTIVYCRASLQTRMLSLQDDRGTGDRLQIALDAQLRQCEEYAAQLGYKIIGHIFDTTDGVDPERESLEELYAIVAEKGLTRVLVSDDTRLAVTSAAAFAIRSKLASLGAQIIDTMM